MGGVRPLKSNMEPENHPKVEKDNLIFQKKLHFRVPS